MEALQEVLGGKDPELVLQEWPESYQSQEEVVAKAQSLVTKLPLSASELVPLIEDPLFSVELAPDLVRLCIQHNLLEVIQQLLFHKGNQLGPSEVGDLFLHLVSCSVAKFTPYIETYKSFKTQAKKQKVQVVKSDKVRYYLLSLLLSSTYSVPEFTSFPEKGIEFLTFMLKSNLYSNTVIPICPKAERLVEVVYAAAKFSGKWESCLEVVKEMIELEEKLETVRSIINMETWMIPAKPLQELSSVTLK